MADDHITDPNMPDDLREIGARIAAGEDPDEIKGVERLWIYRVERDKDKIAESHARFFEYLRKEDEAAEAALAYAIWGSENTIKMKAECIQEHLARAKSVRYWLRVHGHEISRTNFAMHPQNIG